MNAFVFRQLTPGAAAASEAPSPKRPAEQDWNKARDKAMARTVERMMKCAEVIERGEEDSR
jgi:hypothetical protein